MVSRFDCLKLLAGWLDEHAITVTARGPNAREWAYLRPGGANFHSLNLGMCLSFALGLSLAYPRRQVIALDSDGSLLLDTSTLVTVAAVRPANLLALVMDNQSYADMGPTATASHADLESMARGAGIQRTGTVRSEDDFTRLVQPALREKELGFFVVKAEPGKARVEVDSRRLHGRAMKEAFVEALLRHPDHPKSQTRRDV